MTCYSQVLIGIIFLSNGDRTCCQYYWVMLLSLRGTRSLVSLSYLVLFRNTFNRTTTNCYIKAIISTGSTVCIFTSVISLSLWSKCLLLCSYFLIYTAIPNLKLDSMWHFNLVDKYMNIQKHIRCINLRNNIMIDWLYWV